MNRAKVLLYVALVTAAGAAAVHLASRALAARSLGQLDAELGTAAAALQARTPVLGAEALADPEPSRALRRELGVEVTILSDGRVVQSTLSPGDAALVASAALGPAGRPASAGSLAPVRPDLDVALPRLPLLFAVAPAQRVVAVPAAGAGALVALSRPAAGALAAVVTAQWLGLAAVALLALLGLLVAALVHEERAAVVPRELLVAADRLARGDFTARAPVLPGRLGTLSAALNRAAEAAARAPDEAAPAAPLPTGAAPLAAGELAAAVPARGARGPLAPEAAPEPDREPEPDPEPRFAPPPEPPPASEPAAAAVDEVLRAAAEASAAHALASTANVRASAPGASLAAAQRDEPTARDFFAPPGPSNGESEAPAAPEEPPPADAGVVAAPSDWAAGDEDEEHWKAIFQDFQRVRGECGEARDVGYERFREKLQRNRDQLVERFGCRTVRFQVYVKEGKAALKASPVR